MSVEQPHSLGAVLKGAILLIFFVFGVTTYAQSYNAPISYRTSGTTQSTASAEQWSGASVSAGQAASGVYGAANGGYQPAGKAGGYSVNNGFGGERSNYRSEVETDAQQNAYKAYQGAVYEPFNNTPPSRISGRRKGGSENDPTGDGYDDDFTWGGDGEDSDLANPGYGPTGSPVGEPWILLLFAAVASVVIYRKRTIASQKNS